MQPTILRFWQRMLEITLEELSYIHRRMLREISEHFGDNPGSMMVSRR